MLLRSGALWKAAAIGGLALVAAGACDDETIEHGRATESASAGTTSGGGSTVGTGVDVGTSIDSGTGAVQPTTKASADSVSAGTTGGGGAGGGPPASCTAGGDALVMRIDALDGTAHGCGVSPPIEGDIVVEGRVVATDDDSFVIDSCVAGCGQTTTVTLMAPDLALDVPIDDLVRVVAHIGYGKGCAQQILVTDLGTWGGVTNTMGAEGQLRVAAADGTPDAPPEAPFTTLAVGLGCDGGGVFPFDLMFSRPAGGDLLYVAQGELALWPDEASTTTWAVRNLRSYITQNVNDDSNWGYWVAPALVAQPGD